MPPVGAAEHLIDCLFKIGPGTAGEVISYQEIKAWTDLTGYSLAGWEAEMLRSLSGEYLSELHAAEDPARPPPYQRVERSVSREAVSSQLLAAFIQLGAKVG